MTARSGFAPAWPTTEDHCRALDRARGSCLEHFMQLRLRDDLHWCLCGGRIIFLDLEADRYFCLSRSAGQAFIELAEAEGQAARAAPLQSLIARGLLIEGGGAIFSRPPRPPALVSDLLDQNWAQPSFRDRAGALADEARAAWLLRRRPLRDVVRTARRRSVGAVPSGCDAMLRRIAASFAASLFLPAADRCLVRAFALHAACARKSIRTTILFGVRVDPFAAHCWVQHEDQVLIGDYEQARLFTPVLAL
jgi:hypothetical protein